MLIKISWYDTYHQQTQEAVVSTPDAAFSLCQALDKEEHVRQWVCDLVEGEYPWYQEKLWNKLRPWKDWDYKL